MTAHPNIHSPIYIENICVHKRLTRLTKNVSPILFVTLFEMGFVQIFRRKWNGERTEAFAPFWT